MNSFSIHWLIVYVCVLVRAPSPALRMNSTIAAVATRNTIPFGQSVRSRNSPYGTNSQGSWLRFEIAVLIPTSF